MAKQTITLLTDDLEGGEANQTVDFSIDGVPYTIDLNDKNASALRDALQPYIEAGSRVPKAPTGFTGTSTRGRQRNSSGVDHPSFQANRALNQAIRDWADKNGYKLYSRGRIPQQIVNAYHRGVPSPDLATQPELLTVEDLQPPAEAQQEAPARPVAKKAAARTTRRSHATV